MPELDRLTTREREVLLQVAKGLSNAEIATALGGARHGQDARGHVLAKLGVRDRVQIVIAAYESGLVRP